MRELSAQEFSVCAGGSKRTIGYRVPNWAVFVNIWFNRIILNWTRPPVDPIQRFAGLCSKLKGAWDLRDMTGA
jgi:hypothetical protein